MKKEELKAALFDLDGVVIDTETQYSVFWGSQCRLYHPEHPGLENEIKGQTLDQILDMGWSGELESERQVLIERLNAFEAQMQLDYLEGFLPFISDLRQHGMKTAVVTSSNRLKMENVYRQHPEFQQLFDAILTSEDFAESKPSPDCYLRAAQRFGLEREACVVLEDSVNGLRSGRAAGMMVVGLVTTNPLDVVRPLSDCQIKDYTNFDYKTLNELWQAI
ncbi:MAG: HAD family phosphatase [Prevotella sp.]|nr:HAD family phosphatase [Prevotella sp.]